MNVRRISYPCPITCFSQACVFALGHSAATTVAAATPRVNSRAATRLHDERSRGHERGRSQPRGDGDVVEPHELKGLYYAFEHAIVRATRRIAWKGAAPCRESRRRHARAGAPARPPDRPDPGCGARGPARRSGAYRASGSPRRSARRMRRAAAGITPMRRRTATGSATASSPHTRTIPLDGRANVASTRNRVVLPAPLADCPAPGAAPRRAAEPSWRSPGPRQATPAAGRGVLPSRCHGLRRPVPESRRLPAPLDSPKWGHTYPSAPQSDQPSARGPWLIADG